jgi:ribosomal protein S18 acetylase RimI-like enzyme
MNVENVELRAAGVEDLDLVLGLMRGLYASDHISFQEPRARRALAGLLAEPRLGEVWLVEARSEVVEAIGYAVLTLGYSLEFGGRFWLLDELFIRDEQRGRGVGGQVLRRIEEAGRALGLHAIRLEVSRTNGRAQDLYRRAGFAAHDRDLMTLWLGEKEQER